MNWKRLSKLLLALALIAAMFVSSIPAASAEESSPQDVVTDEANDSTIINGDGGGLGNSNSSSNSSHTHSWRFIRFRWHSLLDGGVSAEAQYTCYNCPDANSETGYPVEYVAADVTQEGWTYTVTVPASRSLDGREHTASHTHKWVFDGFEWEMTDDGLKAYALYHCSGEIELSLCSEKHEIEATVTDILNQPLMCKATVTAAQSLDGKEHVEYYNKRHPIHAWIFDRFELDFSEHNWQTNTGVKVYAVYYCRFDRNDHERVEASFSGIVTPFFAWGSASISSEKSLDNQEHSSDLVFRLGPGSGSDLRDWLFAKFDYVFDGFEWDMTDGVRAYAVFHCDSFTGSELEVVKVTADVTGLDSAAHVYQASVTAEQSGDKEAHFEIKAFHEYAYQGFEWDLTNFTAKALFECSCGEQHRVNADMSYPYGNVAKAYVSKYVTPDHEAHEESRIVDFGDYVPYTWNIDGYYEFIGFEWTGTKADACYYYYKRVGCGTFAKEVVKVPAVVTRLTITVIPQYKARIAAWQTPDGVEHTEIKTIILPPTPPVLPDPVPVTPIVGPIEKREINPNLVIWPIGEPTPANP